MKGWNKIASLLINEVKLEWRGKAAFNSILLYVVSITYVLHVSFNRVMKIYGMHFFGLLLLFLLLML